MLDRFHSRATKRLCNKGKDRKFTTPHICEICRIQAGCFSQLAHTTTLIDSINLGGVPQRMFRWTETVKSNCSMQVFQRSKGMPVSDTSFLRCSAAYSLRANWAICSVFMTPDWRETSFPFLNRIIVGIAEIANWADVWGASSVLSFAKIIWGDS